MYIHMYMYTYVKVRLSILGMEIARARKFFLVRSADNQASYYGRRELKPNHPPYLSSMHIFK